MDPTYPGGAAFDMCKFPVIQQLRAIPHGWEGGEGPTSLTGLSGNQGAAGESVSDLVEVEH